MTWVNFTTDGQNDHDGKVISNTWLEVEETIEHLGNMTVSYKVKINQYILGSLLPKNRSFELQVKQPKILVICTHLNEYNAGIMGNSGNTSNVGVMLVILWVEFIIFLL